MQILHLQMMGAVSVCMRLEMVSKRLQRLGTVSSSRRIEGTQWINSFNHTLVNSLILILVVGIICFIHRSILNNIYLEQTLI
jgi:hypothetical protein